MQDFILYLNNAIDEGLLFKLTLAKPKNKQSELRNIFIRPVQLSEVLVYSATFRYKTNDQTKNYTTDKVISEVERILEKDFYNADLFLEDKKVSLIQSKKGKKTILVKAQKNEITLESHNHQKQRSIPESSPYLKDLGISSSNGKVYGHAQDKYRQINRYIELVEGLIKEDTAVKDVVDMGCGKGYLTFALYDYLKEKGHNVHVKGVEIRPDLVKKCNDIAVKNKMKKLSFELGSIDDFAIERSDMVIALHACDIATDMAIAKGLEADAKYIVVAPCCHKQIRKAMSKTNTHLNPLLKYGILKERQAEMITDTIRALVLESKGYSVKVFEFISSDHTGKNIMITAVKTGFENEEPKIKISKIKEEFGILEHYLERLVF